MLKKIILALVLIPALLMLFLWQVQPAWWLTAKAQWLAEFNAERAEQTAHWRGLGTRLGQSADQAACLDRALTDFDGCTGFECTVNYGRFLNACLAVAAPADGFCEDVPAFREEPTEDDKTWAKHACWDRNIRGEGCRLLMRQQQLFCSRPEGADAAAAGAEADR
ncbi:hypothetical protein [Marinobacterium weihaiense]|uniref:Uncharacterized protein n=1 Tax=Marinobacterium weihaiense TaxID=2851016 RepID=A0ABS6MBH2_9GAMM|nr:hypothetical protein [Marinobacterium weihaiense]MBV0933229.1 hypothetical protein [Marinobacterium weihaiense]